MKKQFLLFAWGVVFCCLSFVGNSQKIVSSLNQNTKNPKLKLGLSAVVDGVNLLQAPNNTFNILNYSLFSFKDNNQKILVNVVVDDVSSKKELTNIGAEIIATHEKTITCWLEINKILGLTSSKSINWMQPVLKPIHNSSPVLSQGDAAQRSNIARQLTGLNGTGVKIGVLSDSYDHLNGASTSITAGELPGTGNPNGFTVPVTVLSDLNDGTGDDEGRAMLEIIHDVAPGAKLYFYTAFNSDIDFANGIRALADAGCKVIVDDVIYFNEPYFQDGVIAQAVDYAVNVKGATYFSSAGNQFHYSYEAPFQASTFEPFGDGAIAHNFGTVANPVYFLPVTAGSRGLLMAFQWDEPYLSVGNGSPGSASDLDIYVLTTTDEINYTIEAASFDANIGGDPFEILSTSSTGKKYIMITKFRGTNPSNIKFVDYARLAWTDTPADIIGIKAGTTIGHANAKGAIAVGAASYDKTPAYGVNSPILESFSSRGGTPIYLTTAGGRLATPDDRLKPEIVAPDRANTSFFIAGYDYEPDGIPNFAGTSAAAPHAAAVAGLMLQGNPSLTTSAIKTALIASCVDMDDPTTPVFDTGFDYASGAGLIKADAAVLATLNPNCPSTTITVTRSLIFCEGDSVIFDATTAAGYTFQWKLDGNNIDGATQARLIAKTSGTYNVEITNINCTLPSLSFDVTQKLAVSVPTTVNRTIALGDVVITGNGLQASSFCPEQQSASYTGPTIGYDGNTKSGPDPTVTLAALNGIIKFVTVSVKWRKRNGGTINDCGTAGGNSYPYNNEVSFKIVAPDNTIINLLNAETYNVGTVSSGLVTTVFDDGGTQIGLTPSSGIFKPAQKLSTLIGKNPNGIWKLLANDNGRLDPLCVESFTINIYTDASSGASSITWWDAPSGGNQVGTGSEYIPTNNNIGTYTYYAEASCIGSNLPCPTSFRKAAILTIVPCLNVEFDYVKAGNPFNYKFPLSNNMVIAQVPYETSILVKPICNAVTIESFRMKLQGPTPFENYETTENLAFFSLFNNTGDYILGRNLPVGNYALTITGYSQDNALGSILYGPTVVNFSIVANSATIGTPTFTKTSPCVGRSFDVNFSAIGPFALNNQFQVQLSDPFASFDNPIVIGSSSSIGIIPSTIPVSIIEGTGYKIRVVSTNPVIDGNSNGTTLNLGNLDLTLASPSDDYLSGTTTKSANRRIVATNKIVSSAKVNYQAGSAILLNAGFQTDSNSVFKAEIKGCEN